MSRPELQIRPAAASDLSAIVALLADDALGQSREDESASEAYRAAFAAIERDPNNTVYVLERDGEILGCAQLTIIPGLARRGVTRGQIEGVRIASPYRGERLGRLFFENLIALARDKGCGLVQLTSDKARSDAHRFYEDIGFSATHEGFKMALR